MRNIVLLILSISTMLMATTPADTNGSLQSVQRVSSLSDFTNENSSSWLNDNGSFKSEDINDEQKTCISKTVQNLHKVSFRWKVSSEQDYDYLKFYVDDVMIKRISGKYSWRDFSYDLTSSTHKLKWCYEKDYSISRNSDAGWIDNVNLYANTQNAPQLDKLTSYNNSSLHPWVISQENADDIPTSFKSGDINNDQKSCMSIDINNLIFIGFKWKVSSERSYDYLKFYIDGIKRISISGSHSWSNVDYNLTSSKHTLTWCYEKDYSVLKGSDAGWIDNIHILQTSLDVQDKIAPVFTSNSSVSVDENQASAITLVATDNLSSVTYSISGTDSSYFNINSSTGVVTFRNTPDYETKSSYSFIANATDNVGNIKTQTITIMINNLDEVAPIITSSSSARVDENQRTAITIVATDNNSSAITYSISGTDSSYFNINSSTGVVTFINVPDYETKSSYSFVANATDDTGNTKTQTITIMINDLDDTAPVFTSNSSVSVDEDQRSAITLIATDIVSSVSYSISGTDSSYFNINSSTGVVTFKNVPNYRIKRSYVFTAYATDESSNRASQTITISINNLTTPPSSGGGIINTKLIFSGFDNDSGHPWTKDNNTFKSGDITHNEKSCISKVIENQYRVSFKWKVSSEYLYDYLKFYIDDIKKNEISGNHNWSNVDYNITTSTHTLKWCYTKDGTDSSGSDAGWLDDIHVYRRSIKAINLYIRSAVYNNNGTSKITDDILYVYFSTNINKDTISDDISDSYDINGIGVIGSGSTSVYSTNFYRHKILLNNKGTQSTAFDTNNTTTISLSKYQIQDINGSYHKGFNQTNVTKFNIYSKFTTGQTKSGHEFDDANLSLGIKRDYTRDDINEIVTDNLTGLIWQDNNEAKTVRMNFEDAKAYCSNANLANKKWRLPTYDELRSINDLSRTNPLIDPIFKNVSSGSYWSSTIYAGYNVYAWTSDFHYSRDGVTEKYHALYVRCVTLAENN